MSDSIAAVVYKKVQAEGLPEFGYSGPLLRGLALSPDALYIAGGFERQVKVWQLQAARDNQLEFVKEKWELFTTYALDEDLEEEEELSFLAWTSTDFMLVGTTGGYVLIITLSDAGTDVDAFQATDRRIRFLALDRSDTMLAVGAGDHEVVIYTPEKGKGEGWELVQTVALPSIESASDDHHKLVFLGWAGGDPRILIMAYSNRGIFSWDTLSKKSTLLLDKDDMFSGSLSPDGRFLAVPGRRGTFDIVDLKERAKLRTLSLSPSTMHIYRLRERPGVFIHGGRYFLGSGYGKIYAWNISKSLGPQELPLKEAYAESGVALLTVSSNQLDYGQGTRIIACAAGPRQEIEIWNAHAVEETRNGHGYLVAPAGILIGFLIGVIGVCGVLFSGLTPQLLEKWA